jgi:hypothetical protein
MCAEKYKICGENHKFSRKFPLFFGNFRNEIFVSTHIIHGNAAIPPTLL